MEQDIYHTDNHKGSVSRKYKEQLWVNKKNTNYHIKRWVEDLNRYLTVEETQIVPKHMERKSPTSLVIMEIQIKATIKYHFTLPRLKVSQLKFQQRYKESGLSSPAEGVTLEPPTRTAYHHLVKLNILKPYNPTNIHQWYSR